ncbi:Similar to Lar: Tyrosine-protein phosphatase Lar (Drosophila melanogaster) [Cotesia congregata]|uniref:Similar to Lar: Tyrosine-protein phosphatase Lar (Drosophila melanogaster) n=1 Tax=Cotesia congregata TaxID=51543 RepID=A0A8J2HG77_COTCN|nr:Similar to Lar: Tyrosine-protein phosphatase Lar (Drosophila melanogaster) [Cotesia congregata]
MFTGPPKILMRPRSQHVKAGGIASFYCSAHGQPPPQIHWRKNGKKVSSTASRYSTKSYANGALLRIDPVRANRDEAMWECVAENGVGDAVTAEAQLTVHERKSL